MALSDPVVITCAISGALADRGPCPAIPYTPAQYATEARRIVDEGGVMIHIHARRPDGTSSHEIEDVRRDHRGDPGAELRGDDVIVNSSTGGLVARARRMTEDAGRRVPTVAQARAMLGVERAAAAGGGAQAAP